MGTTGARHARMIIANVRTVLAIEAFCAAQAVEYRGVEKMSPKLREQWEQLRKIVPSMTEDRIFSQDVNRIIEFLLPQQ